MATTAAILEYIVTANTAQANAALAKTQGQLVTMGKTSKASGAAAKAGFAAVGAAAIAAGVAVFKVGEEFDKAYDKIRSQTGATGKEAEKLEKSFRNVLKTVPTDFDSAATAVAGLNQRLGETGKPLTELARQITALAKITGEDVQENVEAVTRLFGDWQVATKDQTDTLDGLFRISQKTGATVSDLARNMVQFGAPLRNLGFDLDQAAAMFGAFEKTGVNITTVLSGLRLSVGNFAKPSDDLAKTMERLNLSAKDTPAAISAMFKEIKTLKSESEATALAIDAFGKRAGPDLVDTIRGGKFELNDLLKTFRSGDGTIRQAERSTRDFGEQWTLFKNRIATVIEPVAVEFFELVGKGMRAIAKIDFKGAINSLRDFWNSAGILRDVIKAVTGFVLDRFRNMIDFLKAGVKLISSILTGDFKGMWQAIKDIFKVGVSAVLAPVKGMIGIIRDVGRRIGDVMSDVFGGAWDKVKGVFESGANAVIGFLNFIISALNRIPGVDIGEIGKVGGGGGGRETGSGHSANATEEHFRGGKVTAPRAIVGEEAPAHPEYVLATNPAYRQRNLRLWQEAGGKLGVPGFQAGGIVDAAGAALGNAGQTVGGAFSSNLQSASRIIDKFPSTSDLPDWLRATGDYALKKAAAFARDKVKNLVESASEAITGGMTSGISDVGGAGYEKIVAMGKQLQAQNFLVAGHPAFPPVGTHTAGSNHYIGRAIDVNWADAAAEPAKLAPLYNRLSSTNPLELYFQNRGIPAPVPDHYDHLHLAYARGGVLGKGDNRTQPSLGRSIPQALAKYNKIFPKHVSPDYGGYSMPPDHVAMLAEFFGMPGVAMAQIAHGESNFRPGAVGDDSAAGYGNTFGYGLWQITTGASGMDSEVGRLGGYDDMLNPLKNAIIAAKMWKARGVSPWLGTRYLTDPNAHWNGNFGAMTDSAAGGGAGGGSGGRGRGRDPSRGQGGIVGFLDSPWAQAATGGRGGGGSSGGMTYTPADIPKKVQDMLTAHSGAISLLDTQIMLAEHFSSYNSSEAGADLGPLEVAEQLFLHQQLLTNLEGLRNWATRGLGLKRTSNKGKKALAGLLPGLVGDATSVGRILETKKRIDELQHPEFAETEGQQFLAEYFKSELLKSNQRFAVSQAQYKVFRDFAGGFAGGGYIPQGKWGVVGESGPEVVGGPTSVMPAGGEGVSVIVNGDIINTPPGMQPVEVRGAKTIVQQGSRGYGRRPLGSARGY